MKKIITSLAVLLLMVMLPIQAGSVENVLKIINDSIDVASKQHDSEKLAILIRRRSVVMYNNALSDSVIAYVPNDLRTLSSLKQWNQYYEVWMQLVNTYIYFEKNKNTALREVKAMFNDALNRDNKYGIGIAYYTMGSVYFSLNNLDESLASYQKGLNILLKLTPLSLVIQEVFSYYGDVLNEQKKYNDLEKLTVKWKAYIDRAITDNIVKESDQILMFFYYDIARIQAALGLNKLDFAERLLIETKNAMFAEDSYEAAIWYTCMAQLRLQQGNYAEALRLNDCRMHMIKPNEDKAVYLYTAAQRSEILTRLGRYEEALNLYKDMYTTKDSINNAETKNQLNEMNTLFQVDELKMEQERAQYRNMVVVFFIIILFLILFAFHRILTARKLNKKNNQLMIANAQIEELSHVKTELLQAIMQNSNNHNTTVDNNSSIFISYSRANYETVNAIKNEIETETKTKCWMDLEVIESGIPHFTESIVNGIDQCPIVLFMRSEQSQQSKYALLELNYASEDSSKHIVIINIDTSKMTKEFRFLYGLTDTIKWEDYRQREKLFRDIIKWKSSMGNHKLNELQGH